VSLAQKIQVLFALIVLTLEEKFLELSAYASQPSGRWLTFKVALFVQPNARHVRPTIFVQNVFHQKTGNFCLDCIDPRREIQSPAECVCKSEFREIN
jgi:hypothetical protein